MAIVLSAAECERILQELAAMTLEERRHVAGLHPDRAPTIVAGVLIFREVLRLFGLDRDRDFGARHPARSRNWTGIARVCKPLWSVL